MTRINNAMQLFRNAENDLTTNLCISLSTCVEAQVRIVYSPNRARKSTSRLGWFLETLVCRGGISEVVAMPPQQELVGHPRDVIANGHVTRLAAPQLLLRCGHGAGRMQIIVK